VGIRVKVEHLIQLKVLKEELPFGTKCIGQIPPESLNPDVMNAPAKQI
jgi:hypothetical protein